MSRGIPKQVVYKIAYPNGKIYIGKDMTNSINYFGGASSELIAQDFSLDQRRSFTITREILWEAWGATLQEVNKKEIELILMYRANDPQVGYNRFPRFVEQ